MLHLCICFVFDIENASLFIPLIKNTVYSFQLVIFASIMTDQSEAVVDESAEKDLESSSTASRLRRGIRNEKDVSKVGHDGEQQRPEELELNTVEPLRAIFSPSSEVRLKFREIFYCK